MKEIKIEIAGKRIGIMAEHEGLLTLCAAYQIEEPAELQIEITPADMVQMREKAKQEDILEGKEPREYSDSYLETLAAYRKIAEVMVDYDTLLMHGSVVAVDGEAYLFTAKSGTGKSTHTRYWREVFGDRAIMVNDDKPLLKLTENGVLACGTPWDGKHHLSTNVCLPLKGICILERGKENEIHPISAQEALPMVFQQTYRPKNLGKYMELIDRLTQKLRFYRMQCTLDPNAAQMAYDKMSK